MAILQVPIWVTPEVASLDLSLAPLEEVVLGVEEMAEIVVAHLVADGNDGEDSPVPLVVVVLPLVMPSSLEENLHQEEKILP